MTNIQFLDLLDDTKLKGQADSILKQLISRGLLPVKVAFHREIILQVRAEMSINGNKKRKAVLDVSSRLDIDESTIWKALSKLQAA